MFKTFLPCLTLRAALEAQPHLPKRGAPTSQSGEQQLATDLTAMAEGATKPSQANEAAAADKNLSSREIAQLTSDFNKVLNSAGISVSEFNAVVSDAQTILKASGISSSDAALIAADLKAIGAEVQKTTRGAQTGDLRKKFGRK